MFDVNEDVLDYERPAEKPESANEKFKRLDKMFDLDFFLYCNILLGVIQRIYGRNHGVE